MEKRLWKSKNMEALVVLSKYLNEIVKKLPKDICIKLAHNNSITIKSGDIETKLNGFNANDYPKTSRDESITSM